MQNSVLIYNARLLDENIECPGAVLVLDKKIRSIFQGYFTSPQTVLSFLKQILKEDGYDENEEIELFDAQGLTLTPAFIDMHVHFRYPGQTQKEDLNSGLKAAACGGYGTVVAMPNTNPPVSSVELAMKIEREAASLGLSHLFQTVTLTKDFDGKTTNHLQFIDPKYIPVISEDGKDVENSFVILEAMGWAAKKNVIVSCHCEDVTLAQKAREHRQKGLDYLQSGGYSILDFYKQNDDSFDNDEFLQKAQNEFLIANRLLETAEDVATFRNLSIAKKMGCPIHIAHVSTEKSLNLIREAKQEYFDFEEELKKTNYKITCEVTPHHLALGGIEISNDFQLVNPPLRSEEDRLSVIEAIFDGTVDVISTDHAPHTLEDKINGAPGFTGLETAFSVCNTVLVKELGLSPQKLSSLMSKNPAQILGLQKGLLKPGFDADLTLINPDKEFIVNSENFYSKGKVSCFEGKNLIGTVNALFIDGRLVFER